MILITGTANPELSEDIAKHLKTKLTDITIKKFACGEIYVKLNETVRGHDVFIIQTTDSNEAIMELLLMIDAARRASANRVTVVIPYYGYGRQDRKAEAREPISAKLIANLITVAGANKILTIDLHASQIQGFFDIPLDDVWAFPLFAKHFKKINLKNMVVVSPDAGGVKRALRLSKELDAPIAMIDKRRAEHNKIDEMRIVGDVEGKNAILFDDMIDTGGTLCQATKAVKDAGAENVYLCATHAVFSNDALEKLNKSVAKEILVTNTIKTKDDGKIKILDISKALAMAIKNINENKSVSTLDKQIMAGD
ncbi:ribose-phosphate pyrophosphokinase [archaeon]|nr:ribose-phosphate pyrophosphokinase [archaeon]MBL7057314.1 ribose-phosphate pyrophosphokinase [Candidatus Woesearchaeota archaeon]